MEELIKIYPQNDGSEVASARDLHIFLESKQDFSHWINNRIKKYGFVKNQDYTSFDKIIERENGATTRIEYAITLDMAKELSMVEGNQKGRIARKFFIDRDKKLKEVESSVVKFDLPSTFSEALQLAANQAKKIEEQDKQLHEQNVKIEADKPKVTAAEILLLSDDGITVGEFAKMIGVGPNNLFKKLKEDKILIANGPKTNTPYQRYIDAGYFRVRDVTKTANNSEIKIFPQTLVLAKGQVYLSNKYANVMSQNATPSES